MRDMPPGKLTIDGYLYEKEQKSARMVKEVTAEVLLDMEMARRRRPSRLDRFFTWLAIA